MGIDKYRKAFTEVREILKYTEDNLVNAIPKSFKNFIEDNYDKEYPVPKIDTTKPLEEQNLLDETLTIISLIYRNYWCDEQQRAEYDKIIKQNEEKFQEELREKYNPDNMFKNNSIIENQVEVPKQIENALVEYKEPNIIKKFFLKIKNIFRK